MSQEIDNRENTETETVAEQTPEAPQEAVAEQVHSMEAAVQTIRAGFHDAIQKNAGITIVMGILVTFAGVLAMGLPLAMGLSISILVGAMLLMGGIGQLVFAFKAGKKALPILLGVLNILMGVYMLSNPGVVLATLTLLAAAYLIVSGVFESIMAFQLKPASGWFWSLISAVISAALGVMIGMGFPESTLWIIGFMVGIRIFFAGWTLLMVGIAARAATKDLA